MPIPERVERQRSGLLPKDGGHTVSFYAQSGSCSQPQIFFAPQAGPVFEGGGPRFERKHKGRRRHILRRVAGIRDA